MKGFTLLASFALALVVATPGFAQNSSRAARDAADRSVRRDATVRAIERVSPAVANIATEQVVKRQLPKGFSDAWNEWFGRHESGRQVSNSLGSGIVVHPAGYILTNAHVVQRASRIVVTLPGRPEVDAKLLSLHTEGDLALLKIKSDSALPYVRLARAGDLLIGETCIALGNPYGLENTVTRGVLSAKNRKLKLDGRQLSGEYLQTDAAINPGNSGGPLINLDAELIGLNTAVHAGGTGIGFAIPVARLRQALAALSNPQLLRDAYLGVVLEDAPDDTGALVATIDPSGPAARAGLRVGDRIVACGTEPVRSAFTFNVALLQNKRPSQRLAVVDSGGKRRGALLQGLEPPFRAPIRERMGLVGRDVTPALAWKLGQYNLRGVQVTDVVAGGPAEALGIRRGDVILKVGHKVEQLRVRSAKVWSQEALAGFLANLPPEAAVMVTVRRKGRDFWGELRLR